MDFDVVIVGGGIIGFQLGIALLESRPSLRVAIIDKESHPGKHASGRNSGVIHAGFYYSPDSLKAKFCAEGNSELKKLCREGQIPVIECGKVVVSQNAEEDERLEVLFDRGIKNGVDLELLDAASLPRFEPLAQTFHRFIWSPNTAVSDPSLILQFVSQKFQLMGGVFVPNVKVSLSNSGGEVRIHGIEFSAKHVVNAAGAHADALAHQVDVAREYAMVPFIGLYRVTDRRNLPISRLVYPVPHPINPFLGVHLTLTTNGLVKIGPTAIPVLGREQYSLLEGWSFADSISVLRGAFALINGSSHDFSHIVVSELPKIFRREIIRQASFLVSETNRVNKWRARKPGIRSQLVHLETGLLEQDFRVVNHLNSTHVLNAVSPGWTSAIPFSRHITEDYILSNM